MLVRCTYEELTALVAGAEQTLEATLTGGAGIAAPPREQADVEALLSRTSGDIELRTLAEQRSVARALDLILDTLHQRMQSSILEGYVGAEDAVVAYFDYAHVLTVHERVRAVGEQMEAVLELIGASEEVVAGFTFGDEE